MSVQVGRMHPAVNRTLLDSVHVLALVNPRRMVGGSEGDCGSVEFVSRYPLTG